MIKIPYKQITENLASDDPYEIMGLSRDCTHDEIVARYRTLSKKHHPDLGGSSDSFAKLSWAYGVLSDPDARELYDEEGIIQEKDFMLDQAAKSCLFEIVEKVIFDPKFLAAYETTDLVDVVVLNLERGLSDVSKRKENAQKALKKYQGILERLRSDWGERCPVRYVVKQRIEQTRKQVSGLGRSAQVIGAAIDLADKIEYDFDDLEECFQNKTHVFQFPAGFSFFDGATAKTGSRS